MSSGPSILCYSDPGIVSLQCSWSVRTLSSGQRKVFVFKPNLHFRFEMGVGGGKGQMGVGLERAEVSVHRSETMFNIT